MKTQVDEVGKNKVKMTVEVPSADVDKLLSKTYKRLAQQVKVPGFRPGKAPKAIIDQRLGKDFVRNEALKDGLPGMYAEAVEEADLDVRLADVDADDVAELGPDGEQGARPATVGFHRTRLGDDAVVDQVGDDICHGRRRKTRFRHEIQAADGSAQVQRRQQRRPVLAPEVPGRLADCPCHHGDSARHIPYDQVFGT